MKDPTTLEHRSWNSGA